MCFGCNSLKVGAPQFSLCITLKSRGRIVGSKLRKSDIWSRNWQMLLAFGFGILFVLALLVLTIFVPSPTDAQFFIFRVVLALAAAGIGAIIPGLIEVSVSTSVRAGGAIALFVLVYLFNPPGVLRTAVPEATIKQTTNGQNSPAVVSQGPVTITDQAKEKTREAKK